MKSIHSFLLTVASVYALVPGVHAQVQADTPRDVVQFSVTATTEARQDLLSVTLRVTREGNEPLVVQDQLKTVLDTALADARASAQRGAMDLRSGNFTLVPRTGRDGRITAWQGTAEMVLSGRDFERIASTAGRLQGMAVAGVTFGLSREERERLETQVQTQAIERFRTRAAEIARSFGFAAYALREVNIHGQDMGVQLRPRLMAAEVFSSAKADAPLPVEAGLATVQVTVSGSVQLK